MPKNKTEKKKERLNTSNKVKCLAIIHLKLKIQYQVGGQLTFKLFLELT